MRPTLHPALVNGRFGDPAVFVTALHARAALLFDCGDLAPLAPRDLPRVEHVLVSHMHMDHFVGFDALLRINVGREKRIALIGPEGSIDRVGHKLGGYTWDLVGRYPAEVAFHVIELTAPDAAREATFRLHDAFRPGPVTARPIEAGVVLDTPAFTVRVAILEHHGPSVAYAVAEPMHVNVWRNRLAERGLAVGPWLKPLKEAVRDGAPDDRPIALLDGTAAPLGALRDLVSIARGQKIGYIADARDTPANRAAIAALCAGADILFIEAAFAAADRAQADHRAHLTTRAAGEIARLAGVRRIEPFHFSPRYCNAEAAMLAEVAADFAG